MDVHTKVLLIEIVGFLTMIERGIRVDPQEAGELAKKIGRHVRAASLTTPAT